MSAPASLVNLAMGMAQRGEPADEIRAAMVLYACDAAEQAIAWARRYDAVHATDDADDADELPPWTAEDERREELRDKYDDRGVPQEVSDEA
jgi:hypothetical protein